MLELLSAACRAIKTLAVKLTRRNPDTANSVLPVLTRQKNRAIGDPRKRQHWVETENGLRGVLYPSREIALDYLIDRQYVSTPRSLPSLGAITPGAPRKKEMNSEELDDWTQAKSLDGFKDPVCLPASPSSHQERRRTADEFYEAINIALPPDDDVDLEQLPSRPRSGDENSKKKGLRQVGPAVIPKRLPRSPFYMVPLTASSKKPKFSAFPAELPSILARPSAPASSASPPSRTVPSATLTDRIRFLRASRRTTNDIQLPAPLPIPQTSDMLIVPPSTVALWERLSSEQTASATFNDSNSAGEESEAMEENVDDLEGSLSLSPTRTERPPALLPSEQSSPRPASPAPSSPWHLPPPPSLPRTPSMSPPMPPQPKTPIARHLPTPSPRRPSPPRAPPLPLQAVPPPAHMPQPPLQRRGIDPQVLLKEMKDEEDYALMRMKALVDPVNDMLLGNEVHDLVMTVDRERRRIHNLIEKVPQGDLVRIQRAFYSARDRLERADSQLP